MVGYEWRGVIPIAVDLKDTLVDIMVRLYGFTNFMAV